MVHFQRRPVSEAFLFARPVRPPGANNACSPGWSALCRAISFLLRFFFFTTLRNASQAAYFSNVVPVNGYFSRVKTHLSDYEACLLKKEVTSTAHASLQTALFGSPAAAFSPHTKPTNLWSFRFFRTAAFLLHTTMAFFGDDTDGSKVEGDPHQLTD